MIRIVLIGGGHSHVVALRDLAGQGLTGMELHLVSPEPSTSYSSLLPGFVAGHWSRSALEIPLPTLCQASGATFHIARATHLDPAAKLVTLNNGIQLEFDYASIDIGAIADVAGPDSLREFGVPVKPLGAFADRWTNFFDGVRAGVVPPHCVVVGAGTAGIELALSIKFGLNQLGKEAPTTVSLIERGNSLVPDGKSAMGRHLRRELKRAEIQVHIGEAVEFATVGAVGLSSGARIPASFVALATGARPHPWLADTGLDLEEGFVVVGPTLQSINHPAVFASGDTAHLTFNPRPKAGVFAVRQGKVLAEQIVRLTQGRSLTTYKPQDDYLKLVSLGRRAAIAEKWSVALSIPGIWSLKRAIDFRFMNGR